MLARIGRRLGHPAIIRWAAFLALCLLYGGIQLGIRAARITVVERTANDDLITVQLQRKLFILGVDDILHSGQPYTRRPLPGYNGFVDRIELDGSFLSPACKQWRVEVHVRSETPGNPYYLVSTSASCTPPARPRTMLSLIGTEEILDLAARLRKAVLVLCAAVWMVAAAMVPAAGGGWRKRLGQVCVAAATFALLAWATDPAQSEFRSVPKPDITLVVVGASLAAAIGMASLPVRTPRSNVCGTCRYDLTGNVSGVCPECGTPTPAEVRRRKSEALAPIVEAIEQVEAGDGDAFVLSP